MSLTKLPSPELVHRIDPALVAVAAAVKVLPSQIVEVAAPASDVGAGSILTVMLSVAVTALQAPEPVTVIVNTTLPFDISVAPGV